MLQTMSDYFPDTRVETASVISDIREHFQELHGLLQARQEKAQHYSCIKCIEKISLKFMLKWKTAVYTSRVYIVQKVIDLHLIVGDSYKSVNF